MGDSWESLQHLTCHLRAALRSRVRREPVADCVRRGCRCKWGLPEQGWGRSLVPRMVWRWDGEWSLTVADGVQSQCSERSRWAHLNVGFSQAEGCVMPRGYLCPSCAAPSAGGPHPQADPCQCVKPNRLNCSTCPHALIFFSSGLCAWHTPGCGRGREVVDAQRLQKGEL